MSEINNESNTEKNEEKFTTSEIPKIITDEKETTTTKAVTSCKKSKKKLKPRIKIFPLIQLSDRSKKKINYFVKEYNKKDNLKSQKISLNTQIKEFNKRRSLKLNLNTEEHLNLENNDSSCSENFKSNTNTYNNNKMTSSNINTIYSYSKKSMNKLTIKNKIKKNNTNSETLNGVFNKLLDIKHKIREIKAKKEKVKKKFLYDSNSPNYNHSNSINKKSPISFSRKINYKLGNVDTDIKKKYINSFTKRNNNISPYNIKSSIFNASIFTPKHANKVAFRNFQLSENKTDNFRQDDIYRKTNSLKRINDHIKYIKHIRNIAMISLARQYKKALEENEKEKNYHYQHMIFPNEMIEKIIKIKEDLTNNKFRNEYFKRLDRYDTHLMSKFVKKKNKNKTKIFHGIFSINNNDN